MALSHQLAQEFPGAALAGERAERALRVPLGVVSPLWAMFGAAAGAGIAYWWLTSWTRAVNIDALSPFAAGLAAAKPAAEPMLVEIVAEPDPEPEAVTVAMEPAAEPALESETVAAEAAPPVEAMADDLTRMTGIGPKLAAALAELGVTGFAQIAAWEAADLAEMDARLSLKGRAVREAWVAQAKRFAKGD